jgi:NAD-specific glutamate dehydrogenase
MTKAEKKAIEARAKDLVKAGIDKELAKVMAKAEFEARLINVVVNHN